MYAALWRALPGGFWAKLGAVVAMSIALLALLFLVVFPALNALFFVEVSTVG